MAALDMKHMAFLNEIAAEDITQIKIKESTYKGSWKQRGGIGAFMMLARKWDRLEERVKNPMIDGGYDKYDVIQAAIKDVRGEGLIDEIRDLRRYLMLVEAEVKSLMSLPATPKEPDPGTAARGIGALARFKEGMENPFGFSAEDESLPNTQS